MRYLLCIMLLISACSQLPTSTEDTPVNVEKPVVPDTTETEEPTKLPLLKLGKKLKLWSTYYYAPMYKSSRTGVELLDKAGRGLGVKLPLKQLCNYMLQGSGIIDGQIYGWGGVNNIKRVNCTAYYKITTVSGRLKFKKDTHVRGVRNYKITAFKTIAVDSNQKTIPYGSKVYIPSMKGLVYVGEDGKIKTHDGIVYALDTGGKIKGNHIDFYVGRAYGDIGGASVKAKPFFGVVKSRASGTFDAYIVK